MNYTDRLQCPIAIYNILFAFVTNTLQHKTFQIQCYRYIFMISVFISSVLCLGRKIIIIQMERLFGWNKEQKFLYFIKVELFPLMNYYYYYSNQESTYYEHVNHVSRVSPVNTLKKKMSCFRGSVVLHTLEHSRTDQIKCIVSQLQPDRRC
jgi:hypothetical protein